MLSFINNIAKSTAIDHFWKSIDMMYEKMKFLIKMQDQNHIYETIPPVFKNKFPRLPSIIDCFGSVCGITILINGTSQIL